MRRRSTEWEKGQATVSGRRQIQGRPHVDHLLDFKFLLSAASFGLAFYYGCRWGRIVNFHRVGHTSRVLEVVEVRGGERGRCGGGRVPVR